MAEGSGRGWVVVLGGALLAIGIGTGAVLAVAGLFRPVLEPFWQFIIWLWDPLVWVVGCALLVTIYSRLRNSISQMEPDGRDTALLLIGFVTIVLLAAYTIGLPGAAAGSDSTAEGTTTETMTPTTTSTPVTANPYSANDDEDDDGVYVQETRTYQYNDDDDFYYDDSASGGCGSNDGDQGYDEDNDRDNDGICDES